jgi:hypothetical protein
LKFNLLINILLPFSMITKTTLFTVCSAFTLAINAQVGINETSPQSSLDIVASSMASPTNNDGILIPRINTLPAINPTVNQQSMLVYLTSNLTSVNISGTAQDYPQGFYFWDNSIPNWVALGGGTKKSWLVEGNSGTVSTTDFLGTTDGQSLSLRTNNIERFRVANGNQVHAMSRGTQASPFYSWDEDQNSGMWLVQGDELAFGAGNREFMRFRERGQDELVMNLPGQDIDFRIESDTNDAMFYIDAANNQTFINSNAGIFATNHFMSSSNDAKDAASLLGRSTGRTLTIQADGPTDAGLFSITAPTSTAIPILSIPLNIAPGIISDSSFNTGSEDAFIGVADNNEGFGAGFFVNINSTGANGSGYGTAEQGYGSLGINNSGAQYSVGQLGSVDSRGRRSSGVFGSISNGTSGLGQGSLGYRTSAGGGGTFYGGYFLDVNAGTDHTDGNGRSSSAKEIRDIKINVGTGAIGGLMGSWSKGDVYGFAARGSRYGMYVQGKTYANDLITQLTKLKETNQVVPSYVQTSTSVDITSKGMGKLINGTTYVSFKNKFNQLASDKDPIIVTVTPIGESKGVHLVSVDKKGFTIKENGNGNSNIQFTWIAIATKIGFENVEHPKEVLDKDYDKNLDGFMVNEALDNENDGQTHQMWFDGKEIRYDNTPAPKSYTKFTLKNKVLKKIDPKRKLQKPIFIDHSDDLEKE